MANNPVSMLRLRKLFQLLHSGISQREISKELKMSRGAMSGYITRAGVSGKSYAEVLDLDDLAFHALLGCVASKPAVDPRLSILEADLPRYLRELSKVGVTRQLLWEEYRIAHPEGYGYTQFKEHLQRHQKSTDYSYHNSHAPGEEMQVDFAGDSLYLTNRQTGEPIKCPVLVCTLPFSGLSFAIALLNATMEHFFEGLNACLSYFGGVTFTVKSDNMKQWVKRSDRYEPAFNDATIEWELHTNTRLTAARVARPKDKAHVEGQVNICYQRIHARLRNEVFYSLNELNLRVMELLEEHNHKLMQGRTYSRYDRFIEQEKPLLLPLPTELYRFTYRKEFTVSAAYHVQIGKERHFYSIPYQYVNQKASVVYDCHSVEIYVNLQRIAIHRRDFTQAGYTTLEAHMPARHQAYKRSKERNAAYYLDRGLRVGTSTLAVITRILEKYICVQQGYKACEGILSLSRHYSPERTENACLMIKDTSAISYTSVKNILERKLDLSPVQEEENQSYLPEHENIRGASSYQ